ncbi:MULTISPECIES: EamA family transporter [unclassified Nocardioides]|uniref:EamA family transporter n=1 Tax=unclassified Nocardioides TaxID=2615069 RepID=UPI0006F6ED22|nr:MULTISPECIES: EamA family transporter [unclassified Nocardioides]KQY64069.1 hypothetical protein ASD30_03625 [Nocardioides sp. Root140]KRF16075.1 hypothetical protein ASH02_05595 [Nocardioides sp. Soil796]
MTSLLALLGAFSYGLSDFVGGLTSRRTSPWAVAFVASVTGGLLTLGLGLVLGGEPATVHFLWGAVGGIGNGFGTAFLYRGLSGGRMGVVAPISGVGAALVPVVVGLATGERPNALVWLGIAAALPGIWLVAREPVAKMGVQPAERNLTAVLDGALAGLGFGSLFAALAQIPDEAGLLPLTVNQVVACAMVAVVATTVGRPWVPREPMALVGAVSGVLGAAATIAFLLATHHGDLTVAAILASLYPAFTILLAATVLREHIHRSQGVGLALCVVAVALVAGAS